MFRQKKNNPNQLHVLNSPNPEKITFQITRYVKKINVYTLHILNAAKTTFNPFYRHPARSESARAKLDTIVVIDKRSINSIAAAAALFIRNNNSMF